MKIQYYLKESDIRTLGETFYFFADELSDITWIQAFHECTISDAQYENRVRHFYISVTPVKCCNKGGIAEYNNSTIYFIKREFVQNDNIA